MPACAPQLGGARLGSATSLEPCRNPASQPLRGGPWEADWGADAQVRPHCPLITSAGVGEPLASGEPAGRRAAVWLLHSRPWRVRRLGSRDPLVKASGQTTVAVRTPRIGAERGPSPLQSWPLTVAERPSRFLFFFNPTPPPSPTRQVRLLQTQIQPWRRTGPEPGQWASPWGRRPRIPSPQPRPCILNWLLGHWSQQLSTPIDSFLTVCPAPLSLSSKQHRPLCGKTEPRKSYTPPTLLGGAVWPNPSLKVPDRKGRGRGTRPRCSSWHPLLSPHLDPLQSETAPQGAGSGVLGSSAPPLSGFLRFWAQSFKGDPGSPASPS